MDTSGGRRDSMDELVLDSFISQLDFAQGRATLMLTAALAVLAAGYALAAGMGDAEPLNLAFWGFVVIGNLVTVYILTVYQKPPGAIEREVL